MKQFPKKTTGLLLIVFFAMILINTLGESVIVSAATMKMSNRTATLDVGKTKSLSVNGTKKKVTWYTSKKSVATVNSKGKVTAKAPGTAIITASVAGKKLTSKITVKQPIKISQTSLTLEVDEAKTLKVTGTTKKVTFSSSNKSIASVSSSGKITAKAAGTVTITASVDGKKLTSKVTVIKLNSKSKTLTLGDTTTLKVAGTKNKVTFSSSKKSVATVSSNGKVTAKGKGSATITASVDGKKLTSKISVKEPIVSSSNVKTVPKATPTPAPVPTPVPTPPPSPIITPTFPSEIKNGRLVGYYAAWSRYSGFSPLNIDAGKLTHINYSFANIDANHKITLGYPDIDVKNINELNQLKKTYPHLKTIIAVGGWTWSGRFSDVALTKDSREVFADSVVDFIVKYKFDGVDIDWEYPVSGGLATNIRRPADKQNFTLLMKELREKLDDRGAMDGKHYILSFAGAAGAWYTKNTELDLLAKYVDYANIMTYDIHGTWESMTNFNAPLYHPYDSGTGLGNWSVDASVNSWLIAGFPKEKLVMGVPFYGYIYKSVPNINLGLYQTYSGGASISYANIAANYLNKPEFKRYFHGEALVPWLFDGSTFISYEDEQSIAAKARYIKEKGLGGAMIWEISQDPNRVLLNALFQSLK